MERTFKFATSAAGFAGGMLTGFAIVVAFLHFAYSATLIELLAGAVAGLIAAVLSRRSSTARSAGIGFALAHCLGPFIVAAYLLYGLSLGYLP